MGKNKRILIVDDQKDLREQLAKLLMRSGRKNETVSLVEQMRKKLLGTEEGQEETEIPQEDGYEVDIAGQGKDAYEMVKKALNESRPYALMFTDMRMPPGWDGLETSKKVRELDRNIEIVIMTAYADHDQETIAETVGTPEKLLYIKKPFQSEEIFQLALSLTSKWNFEETERLRKEWLEILIRCMSRIKTTTGRAEEIYSAALKAVLNFTASSKGFICLWDSDEKKWKLENAENLDKAEVEKFMNENSKRLTESRTTQSFEGKYILPLKREGFSAAVVIYDIKTQNDPEWYKLLSLLVMTASEVLSNISSSKDFVRKSSDASPEILQKSVDSSKTSLEKISGLLKEKSGDALDDRLTADIEIELKNIRNSLENIKSAN